MRLWRAALQLRASGSSAGCLCFPVSPLHVLGRAPRTDPGSWNLLDPNRSVSSRKDACEKESEHPMLNPKP